MMHKAELRSLFSQKRDDLGINEKRELDKSINEKLIKLIDNSNYWNVHVFLPMRSEPNIYPFINYILDKRLTVACPKSLAKGRMENYVLKSTKELSKGIYGTSYPANSVVFNDKLDLIIVPGLAYCKSNDRLGYGGGYYDRFLINHKDAFKVAPAYNFQIVDSLPCEGHDVKVDVIIT